MSTHDTKGRPYARLSELKQGDMVECDAGFTCIAANATREVQADSDGDLWIRCTSDRHYLDGQADDGEHCVGVYRVSTAA